MSSSSLELEDKEEDDDEAKQTATTEHENKTKHHNHHHHQYSSESEDSSEEDMDNNSDNDNRYWPPPKQKTVELVCSINGKAITAFAFDSLGERFAAGGHDNQVKIWNFKSAATAASSSSVRSQHNYYTSSSKKTTQTRQPLEAINCQLPPSLCGSMIGQLAFSADNQLILLISSSCQAIVLSSLDGSIQANTNKGDQYISDMANTTGHTQLLNDGCWRPSAAASSESEFITCSNDATIRLWDLQLRQQQTKTFQKTVIKTRSPINGLKTIPSICRYSRDALSIVAGCQDGSVLLWDTRRKFVSPSMSIRSAHLKGSQIGGLDFGCGGAGGGQFQLMCTRSDDGSCKLWDLRQLRKSQPLAIKTNLATTTTNCGALDCCFSPDDRCIMLADGGQRIIFLGDTRLGQLEEQTSEEMNDLFASSSSAMIGGQQQQTSVLRVSWQPKINHLAYTSSDGQIYVTYDSRRSLGGGFAAVSVGSAASIAGKQQQQQQRRARGEEEEEERRTRGKKRKLLLLGSDEEDQAAAVLMNSNDDDDDGANLPTLSAVGGGPAGQAAAAAAAIKKKIITPKQQEQQQHSLALFCEQKQRSSGGDDDGRREVVEAADVDSAEARETPRRREAGAGGGGGTAAAAVAASVAAIASKWQRQQNAISGSSSGAEVGQKRSYKPEALPTGWLAGRGAANRPAGSTLSSYIAKSIAKPIDDDEQATSSRQQQQQHQRPPSK